MILAEIIVQETQVTPNQIMLLRHGNNKIATLRQFGAMVEEYTCIQPIGSRYDYHHPNNANISVVAVIVDDCVYGLYRIAGFEAAGTNYDLGNEAHQAFEVYINNNAPPLPCIRFQMIPITSVTTGLPVSGWNAPIQTILKFGNPLFDQILVPRPA